MDVLKVRNELRRMKRGDLYGLASGQRISRCLVGGRACGLYFRYKDQYFCVSEILGKGCLYQGQEEKKETLGLPSTPLFLEDPSLPKEEGTKFRVYYRDRLTRSMTLLGRIVERRTKERKNNLRDLLIKATRDFSDRVSDPSLIFLLGP